MSLLIHSDDTALEAIKPASRLRYKKVWKNFKEFSLHTTDLEVETPKEEDILRYIRHLRDDNGNGNGKFSIYFISINHYNLYNLGLKSSSMWCTYSMLNAVIKNKYGFNLKYYVRVTNLLKSYDVDIKKKAEVFTPEDIKSFVENKDVCSPYWLVRKVRMID